MSMMLLKRSEQEYLVIGRRLNEVSCLTASHFHVHKTALSFGDITIASCDTFPRTMTCYLSVSFRNRHLKCHKSPQFQIFTFTISNKLKGNVNHTVFSLQSFFLALLHQASNLHAGFNKDEKFGIFTEDIVIFF